MTQRAAYSPAKHAGFIAVSGEDAASFLQAQLTSDVAALARGGTQYSGYCSPQGRLLATFLLWRRPSDFVLQLPAALRESVQARLARYVLRARVRIADATQALEAFDVHGDEAALAVAAAGLDAPQSLHDVVATDGACTTQLPLGRYTVLAESGVRDGVRARLAAGREADASMTERLDIESGVPVITPPTQDVYVPQMVNLDLVGGVSFSKGCYPGQEIVARMHYLGRLKQRMYRVRLKATQPVTPGTRLFSAEFGASQASGAILQCIHEGSGTQQALAVIQISAVATGLRLFALDGPPVEFLPLPYAMST